MQILSWALNRRFSPQTNVLAIYGGIAEPSQYQAIWDRFFIDDAPRNSSPANTTIRTSSTIFEAAPPGQEYRALRLIHTTGGRMVKAGATSWGSF